MILSREVPRMRGTEVNSQAAQEILFSLVAPSTEKSADDGKRLYSDGRFIERKAKQREEVWRRVGSRFDGGEVG